MSEDRSRIDEEPDIPLDEPEIPLDPAPDPVADVAEPSFLGPSDPEVPMGLMQVLPANFELPKLIRFIPDQRLKTAADDATRYLLAIDIAGPEGIAQADVALTAVRQANAAIVESFREPAQLAYDVHKSITGTRAEWLEAGERAIKTVGQRVAAEQIRLKRIADEAHRQRQEEEDRKARERARQQAEEAAKRQAPKAVVEQMRQQAAIATAPPVPRTIEEPPKLTGQTVVKPWKARLKGTPAEADPNPAVADLSVEQLCHLMTLLQAIIEQRTPVTFIELNWSNLNAQAKAQKQTLTIPGIEAFEEPGLRAKGGRKR